MPNVTQEKVAPGTEPVETNQIHGSGWALLFFRQIAESIVLGVLAFLLFGVYAGVNRDLFLAKVRSRGWRMAVYDLNVSMLVRELNRVSVSVSPRCILLYKLAWNPTAGCVSDSRRLCGHALMLP